MENARKAYLDNIRWVTVVLVVVYHVFYMYNGEGILGTLGKITRLDVQYYDVYQYMVYPWFMTLLFMVSGICSKLYLDGHTEKEYIKSRTNKLLVPSTIGPLLFGFVQGYINMSFGGGVGELQVPGVVKYLILSASGIGVLWYIQLLWVFSMALLPIRRLEKGRLWALGGKAGLPALLLLSVLFFCAGQVLNTPIICVYRFGLYFTAFLTGYFVLSHDTVIALLKKHFALLCPIAVALGAAFCIRYFGQNYADAPVNRTPLFLLFGYFACLAMLGGFARFFDRETGFTKWMSAHSFGLYVFHYLGISSEALFLAKPGLLPPAAVYPLSLAAGFAAGYGLYALVSRLPLLRWVLLGITKKK